MQPGPFLHDYSQKIATAPLPLAIHPADEFAHSLGRCWILILWVKTLSHAVDFTALQTLVELAAFAKRGHHHVRGDRHQAQVFLGARRATAKVTLDQWTDVAVEIRCAAAQHQRAGEESFH